MELVTLMKLKNFHLVRIDKLPLYNNNYVAKYNNILVTVNPGVGNLELNTRILIDTNATLVLQILVEVSCMV